MAAKAVYGLAVGSTERSSKRVDYHVMLELEPLVNDLMLTMQHKQVLQILVLGACKS
jgi:hypothetical protein